MPTKTPWPNSLNDIPIRITKMQATTARIVRIPPKTSIGISALWRNSRTVGWGCACCGVWGCDEVGGGICWVWGGTCGRVWDGDSSPDLSGMLGLVFSDLGSKLLTVVPPTTCWALAALLHKCVPINYAGYYLMPASLKAVG